METRLPAGDVISRYYSRDLPPSDCRVLFAAILMQVKRDIQYDGGNKRLTGHVLDARRWIMHQGDPDGITFKMCCEALNLDEVSALKFLTETPYKGRRKWNGRGVRFAETRNPSDRISSKRRKSSSPLTLMSERVPCAVTPPSISFHRMMPCSTF